MQILKVSHILRGSMKVGLYHHAHVRMLFSKLPVKPQRIRGARGIFHIDSHEVVQLTRMFDEAARQFKTRRPIDFQTKLGQLNGNIRVQLAGVNVLEDLQVLGNGAPSLVDVMDMLAENVESGGHPLPVEAGCHIERLIEGFARDVAARDLPHNRFWYERQAVGNYSIQDQFDLCSDALGSGIPPHSVMNFFRKSS